MCPASGPRSERQITAARRFYNAAVNQLNTAIQIFPQRPHRRPRRSAGHAVLRGRGRGARGARGRGLTIVTVERGLLRNLVARAGSGIERVALEDPHFEGVFEAYGFDQVQARVVLTATMLERLKALDELAHARGFTCAFRDQHLLIAFEGMRWRCALWRVLQPVQAWLPGYRAWLEELIGLPARVVATLDLDAPAPPLPGLRRLLRQPPPAPRWSLRIMRSFRLGCGGWSGRAASQSSRSRRARSSAAWPPHSAGGGWEAGLEGPFGGYALFMILLGLAYGAGAISVGVDLLARLAWTWGAPLRGIAAPPTSNRLPDGLA